MDIDKSEIEKIKEKQAIQRSLRSKKRRNIILNTITIVLAVGGIVWAINFFYRYYRYEITNDATIEQYVTPINARVSGYVKYINFTEHQKVNAGDTLLIIDDSEYRIKLMDAQAGLMDAQASIDVINSGITTSTSNVAVSEANIQEAKAKYWKSEQDYKRYENLLKADAISQQQFDQVKSEYEALKAHYSALEQQKQALKSAVTETQNKRKNAEASILRKQAELDLAKLNLSYTVILAPFSGYVGRRSLEVGQYVQAGQTITNMIKDDNKWIIANYREKQISNIYIGQDVKIKVDAFNNKTFRGKVTAISEATGSKYSLLPTDNSAGNFVKIQQRIPVRIDFVDISDEDLNKLRAGMMVITEAINK